MEPQSTQYIVPSCLDHAIALREQFGERSCFIAGGTEVVPMLTRGKLGRICLIELTRLPELGVFEQDGGGVRIGAGVTLSRIQHSSLVGRHWPALSEASASIREPQVRNRGTIGGNLAHGVPSADLVPALLALEATVKVKGAQGERLIAVAEFLVGPYKTALKDDEILVEVQLPGPRANFGSAFQKLTKFRGSGLSIATVAAALTMRDGCVAAARVAIGSAGPIPQRVRAVEELLSGHPLSAETLTEAGRLVAAAAEPRKDSIRATPAHRRRILEPLAQRALCLAAERSSHQPR